METDINPTRIISVDYFDLERYFSKDFTFSKIITTTSVDSMKVIIRKRIPGQPKGEGVSIASLNVFENVLVLYETKEGFLKLKEDSEKIRQELMDSLDRLSTDYLFSFNDSPTDIGSIVYVGFGDFETHMHLGIKMLPLNKILEHVQPRFPKSEIIDSGYGLRILIKEADGSKLGQITFDIDKLIITPNIQYFSSNKNRDSLYEYENIKLLKVMASELSEIVNSNVIKSIRFNNPFRDED